MWCGWIVILAWKCQYFYVYKNFSNVYDSALKAHLLTLKTLKSILLDSGTDGTIGFVALTAMCILVWLVVVFFLNIYRKRAYEDFIGDDESAPLIKSKEDRMVEALDKKDAEEAKRRYATMFKKGIIPD